MCEGATVAVAAWWASSVTDSVHVHVHVHQLGRLRVTDSLDGWSSRLDGCSSRWGGLSLTRRALRSRKDRRGMRGMRGRRAAEARRVAVWGRGEGDAMQVMRG